MGELSLETLPPGVVPAGCGPRPGSGEPGPHLAEEDVSPVGKAWGAWASRWAGGSLQYPHSGLGSALPSRRRGQQPQAASDVAGRWIILASFQDCGEA